MSKNFYTVEELKDWELLKLFNDKIKLNNLGQTPKKWYFDASGYTHLNQYTEIELKNRQGVLTDNPNIVEFTKKNKSTYTATTVYIEPQHYARMIDDFRYDGVVPLYINFLADGSVIVWNLATLKKKPEWKYVTHIWDEGKKEYKDEWRILLELEEAFIYDCNNNLIKKPFN
jgi:hypothetical protein